MYEKKSKVSTCFLKKQVEENLYDYETNVIYVHIFCIRLFW